MALDKPQAVPVDVHMWQIAQRDYSWHPTTSQAKGPSPQANKELGKESGMLELVMGWGGRNFSHLSIKSQSCG